MAGNPAFALPAAVTAGALRLIRAGAASRWFLLLAGLFVLALVLGLAGALRNADMRPLHSGASEADRAAMAEALSAAAIVAEVDQATGTLKVGAADYHRARMLLAAQGLPKGGTSAAEMLNTVPMGASRAVEAMHLQQATESEIARSIMTIDAVETARVHLAVGAASLFERTRVPPSASVVLMLRTGRALGDGQVRAIAHLVAASVPGLATEQVAIVDQSGALLSRDGGIGGGDAGGEAMRRIDYRERLEALYRRRIVALLTPVAGAGNFSAEVSVELDFDRTERVRERFDRDGGALRSEHGSGGTDSPTRPQGIPGALSNIPALAAAQAGNVAAVPAPPARQSETYTRNYEVGRETEVRSEAVGDIRRVTAAVILRKARGQSAADLAAVETMVRDALGLDPARGDRVTVRARGFAAATPADALPWWRSEEAEAVRDIGIPVIIAFAVLVLLVLPLRRRILRAPPVLDDGHIAPVVERLPSPADQSIRIEAARTLVATDRQAATRALEVMVRT